MSKSRSKKQRQSGKVAEGKQLLQPGDVPSLDRDDLTLIDGILPHLELALNSIGIRKYSDLKNYSAERLARLLQQRAGIDISIAAIEPEKWIESARRLAEKSAVDMDGNDKIRMTSAATVEPGNDVAKEKNPRTQETAPIIMPEGSMSAVPGKNIPKARTADVAPEPPIADKPVDAAAEPPIADKPIDATAQPLIAAKTDAQLAANGENNGVEVSLTIAAIHYHQRELPRTAKSPAKKVLQAEVSCQLAGKQADLATQYRFPLHIQIHAMAVETEQSALLAEKSLPLTPLQSTYKLHLEFEIPPAGYYQLHGVAFLLAPAPRIDFKTGPFLRVVSEPGYQP